MVECLYTLFKLPSIIRPMFIYYIILIFVVYHTTVYIYLHASFCKAVNEAVLFNFLSVNLIHRLFSASRINRRNFPQASRI